MSDASQRRPGFLMPKPINMKGRRGIVPPGTVYIGRQMRFLRLPRSNEQTRSRSDATARGPRWSPNIAITCCPARIDGRATGIALQGSRLLVLA
jgi:hypothetical protein